MNDAAGALPFAPAAPTGAEVAIDIADLHFTYAGGEQPALRGVSLQVRRGEMVVVMGSTGAGKSTLAKTLNCTIPSFQRGELSGRIAVLGRPLEGLAVADMAGVVGLVLQDFEAQLFATDVLQEIAFGLEQLGVPPREMDTRIREALGLVGLTGFEHRDPTTLSGGEKQRLAIAAVLAMRPPLVVLDEPTTDLDPLGKGEVFAVLAALRRQGHTLVLVEHEIEAAESADRIVLMRRGSVIADGQAAEILPRIELLREAGVRPRDVDRIAAALRLEPRCAHVSDLEEVLRRRGTVPHRPLAPATPRDERPFLEVDRVSYAYAGGAAALRDVSLRIDPGEFVALIGHNGSGKTTLAKLLNGLLRPAAGEVRLRGTDIAELPLSRVAGEVGYVFQDPDQQIFAASVREEVRFGPFNLGVREPELSERVAGALAAVGLSGIEEADPFLLGKGQRQRLAVAALLAQRPQLLILDEPTTGLDFTEQSHMMQLVASLRRQGITLVVITHSPWVVAEYAERGILLSGGSVLFDGPLRALFAQEDLLLRSHFRVPDATRLGNRFGASTLSVEELLAALPAEAEA